MKRCIISACLIMVCSLVFAQVKVGSDGKVAIGTDTAAPLSILSVNSKGDYYRIDQLDGSDGNTQSYGKINGLGKRLQYRYCVVTPYI